MNGFETSLSRATDPQTREILAAITFVVNSDNETLYSHASGFQSLAADAPPVSPSSNIVMGSAGKFITHIAALQLVERGVIGLDDPVHPHLPEFENLQIISPNPVTDSPKQSFTLRPATKQITLRHLMTHTSGLSDPSHPLISAFLESGLAPEFPEGTNPIIKFSSMPLLFEPGERWSYGCSINWLWLLISRVSQSKSMVQHVEEHISKPLGMTSSSYAPQNNPEIRANLLQMVRREGDKLVVDDYKLQELVCSITDLRTLIVDLLSSSSKILSATSIDLLFTPQLEPSSTALTALRIDTEDYAAPAGIPPTMIDPPINFSLAGALLVEDQLPLSGMPKGTLTWNGMPNVVWAINRERGVGMLFATQLLPVDDVRVVEIMMEFMRCAWGTFGVNCIPQSS